MSVRRLSWRPVGVWFVAGGRLSPVVVRTDAMSSPRVRISHTLAARRRPRARFDVVVSRLSVEPSHSTALTAASM
jgi:hypothetical protein